MGIRQTGRQKYKQGVCKSIGRKEQKNNPRAREMTQMNTVKKREGTSNPLSITPVRFCGSFVLILNL